MTDRVSEMARRIAELEAALAESRQEVESLRVELDWFRRLMSFHREGVAVHQDGVVVEANAALAEMLGLPVSELIGRSGLDFVSPAPQASMPAQPSPEEDVLFETLLRRADGTAFPVEISGQWMEWQGRRYRVATVRDITARKQIEERYRMLAENARDVIWMLDLEGRFTYVSPSVERLRGYTPEEVIGQSMDQALTPDSLKLVQERLGRIVQREAAGIRLDSEVRMELEQPCKDGSTVWTEVVGSVIHDDQGRFVGILGATRDITERREMREALARERNLLRTLIDHLPNSVYLKDLEGHFLLNNAESLRRLGLKTQEETLGKTTADFYPEQAAAWRAIEEQVTGSGKPVVTEERVLLRSGEECWVQSSYLPLFDSEGRVTGMLGINQDITVRKLAEQRNLELALERERADMLARFIGDASHDLKTPLTSMLVSLAILAREPEPELQRQHLASIKAQVSHLQRLLDDLLSLVRLDRSLELSPRRYDLNLVVRDVLNEWGGRLAAWGHTLALDLVEPDVWLNYDYQQMYRALAALVDNAIVYTPPGGTITLQTRREGAEALIRVRDTGAGIAPEHQDRVFDRFYRVDPARTSGPGGLGLGLPIARKIVEAHGGRISLESVPGQGSTFTIHLPLNAEQAQPPSAQSVSPSDRGESDLDV